MRHAIALGLAAAALLTVSGANARPLRHAPPPGAEVDGGPGPYGGASYRQYADPDYRAVPVPQSNSSNCYGSREQVYVAGRGLVWQPRIDCPYQDFP